MYKKTNGEMLTPSLRDVRIRNYKQAKLLNYKPSKLNKGNDKLCIVLRGDFHTPCV